MIEEIEVADSEENRKLKVTVEGNVFILTRSDPYGLWTISAEKGKIADVLRGMYTTTSRAIGAIQGYVNLKKKEV